MQLHPKKHEYATAITHLVEGNVVRGGSRRRFYAGWGARTIKYCLAAHDGPRNLRSGAGQGRRSNSETLKRLSIVFQLWSSMTIRRAKREQKTDTQMDEQRSKCFYLFHPKVQCLLGTGHRRTREVTHSSFHREKISNYRGSSSFTEIIIDKNSRPRTI